MALEPTFRFRLVELPPESRIRGVRSSRNSLIFVCAGCYQEGRDRLAGNLHFHPKDDEQSADTGSVAPTLLGICFGDGVESTTLRRWMGDRREPGSRIAIPTLLRLWRELRTNEPCPHVLDSLGHEVLGWLDPSPVVESRAPQWLRSAYDRVVAEPMGGHTLSSIANDVSIDRTHLAREYRRHFGMSVGEHSRRLRIAMAWEMLGRGHTIESAATRAGFYDSAHLKRHLVAATGWSTKAIRAQLRN